MASTKEYLDFVMDSLSGVGEVTYRPMMGEYIIYYKGKILGGIYDDRFLIKPTKSARELLPYEKLETPYDGAKEMLLVSEMENKAFFGELFEKMYAELPNKKR